MDGLDRIAEAFGQLRNLEARVRGVATAVVEEEADVVRPEDLDQALILGSVRLETLQFVPAGAERPGRRVAKCGNGAGALLARIDEVLAQRADDSIAAGEHPADPVAVLAGGFDETTGAGIDHRRDTAGLGIESVSAHRR